MDVLASRYGGGDPKDTATDFNARQTPLGWVGVGADRSARTLRANLIGSPERTLDIGAEVMYGERKPDSGAAGGTTRLRLFAKYGF